MKILRYLFVLTSILFISCDNFYIVDEQNDTTTVNTSFYLSTRSSEELPPFNQGSISFEAADTLVSENSGYIAFNINFNSDYVILARRCLGQDVYDKPVEVWQNLVIVKNKKTSNETKLMVSLIPDSLYYSAHQYFDWNNFKHLHKDTDFTGYEIRTDWETGMIHMVNYYQNGNCMYRVVANGEIKIDFIKSILKQIYLTKINLFENHVYIRYEEQEDYEFDDFFDADNERRIGKIRWTWIELHGVDDQNHGDLPEDGSGSSGPGTQTTSNIVNNNNNYSLVGNETLFCDRVICGFGEYDFLSTPCVIVSMALRYHNITVYANSIWNYITSTYGNGLSIYQNCFSVEDIKKVIGSYFNYHIAVNVKQAIRNRHPVFCAYNPTGSPNNIVAVLVIGYLETGEYLFYSPEDNCLKVKSAASFDNDLSFELINPI